MDLPSTMSVPNGVPTTLSRSCVSCYRRKLKCDRQLPCSRCRLRNMSCSYPDSKITRNRPKAASEQQKRKGPITSEMQTIGIQDAGTNLVTLYTVEKGALDGSNNLMIYDSMGHGRLLSATGRINVKDQREQLPLTPLTEGDLHDGEDEETMTGNAHCNFFGVAKMMTDFMGHTDDGLYQPTPDELEVFWTSFCQTFDPIIRLIHKPSVRRLLDDFRKSGKQGCTPGGYCLILAMVDASVYTMAAGEPERLFGETRDCLLKKIRQAMELALSRAELAKTHDLITLQAFGMYITTRIFEHNGLEIWQTLWSQVALAMRIAVSMELHKDGSKLGLSPFEAEMRRRLWWHIIMLQIRTSENYSCDPWQYGEGMVDLPMNINDEDMDPSSHRPPQPRTETTEMTMCIIKYESISAAAEAVSRLKAPGSPLPVLAANSQDLIKQFGDRLRTKYLEPAEADPTNPMNRLVSHMGSIAILKMCWIWGFAIMRHAGQQTVVDSTFSNLSDELFITATKMLEKQLQLQRDPALENWRWILRNFNVFQAVTVTLTQLLFRLQKMKETRLQYLPDMLRDAWEISESALQATDSNGVEVHIMKPLAKMREEVRELVGVNKRNEEQETAPVASYDESVAPFHGLGDMEVDGLGLGDFEVPQDGFDDPWPLFIPANFFVNNGF